MSNESERYTASLSPDIFSDLTPVDVFEGQYEFKVDNLDGSPTSGKVGYSATIPEGPQPHAKSGQIVLMTSSWSEFSGRGPQLDRQRAISATLGIPVIAVDMLGQSPNSSSLKGDLRKSVASGDFASVSRLLWETANFASRYHGLNLSDKEVIVFGMSQGATLAGAMLEAAPEGQGISDVVLWNTPSFTSESQRSWRSLGRAFLRSGTDFDYYAGLNPEWAYKEGPKDAVRFVRHGRGLLFAPVKGMARARTDEGIFTALSRRAPDMGVASLPRIHVINGSEDVVSLADSNEIAVDFLVGHTSAEVRHAVQRGEYHGVTNLLGAVASVAADVVNAKY